MEESTLLLPFWKQNRMYQECVTMIRRANGEVTGKLLFRPRKILSVQNNALDREFVEGKDFLWDGESAELRWIEGSEIGYFTQNDLEGRDEAGEYFKENEWDALGRSRFRNALFSVSPFYYKKQIAVTYEFEPGDFSVYGTPYQGERIPHMARKLRQKEDVRILFYGDSIFVGCDCSAIGNRPPMQQSFSHLVERELARKTGCRIEMLNPSEGGRDTIWGRENAARLAAAEHPDFVFIGFGMNDGGKTGEDAAASIRSIMETVRAENPACEFLIVVPMVANAESGFLSTQVQFSEAYAKLAGPGAALVDMFRIHEEILKHKDFSATSGNNINHPNDWLIRVYAMNLLSALLPE